MSCLNIHEQCTPVHSEKTYSNWCCFSAKSIDAEPGPNILRTEGINVIKGYIKNTNDKMDNTKETNEELIPFCIFCLQPSYKDSTDCKKHCTNLDVKQGKISTREKKIIGPLREIISPQRKLIRTKDLKVKDDIFEGIY